MAKLAPALLLLGLLGGGAVYVLALQAAKEQAEHDRDLARATPTSTPRHEEPTWKPPSLAPNTFALLTGTDAPGPRAAGDLPMVVWDGKRVLALSGTVETGSSNALHVYDPLRNVWTVAIKDGDAGAPPKRHSGTLAWDGARAFLFGGMRVKDDGPGYHNDLWSYHPAANTWTKKIGDDDPGSPPARYGHSMFWDGSRLFLFGGYREESRNMNDLWAYDPRTNVWEQRPPRGPVPSPRVTWSSMVWTGKQAILFGGGGDTVSNDLWWYEPRENLWVQKLENGALGSPPPRNGPATAWDGKRLFVFGGEAGGQKLNDLWAYDPDENRWIERIPNGLASSPRARAACAMVPIGASFLIFGGWTGNFDIYLHDVWLYRP